MRKTCIIISGGEASPIPPRRPGDLVIACDRGYVHARAAGVRCDLLISDFDSYTGDVDPAVETLRYASEKDDTDTMLAVRYAVEHGWERLELCCALGGRLDHAYANLQAAAYAARAGLSVRVCGNEDTVWFLRDGALTLPRQESWSLSVFAWSETCTGVDIHGTKYELTGSELTNAFPLGVSNQWRQPQAQIRVATGLLMIVVSKL